MKLLKAVEDWMVNYKKNSVKPATYDRLRTSFELMEKYDISDVELDKLSIRDLQDYVNELVDDGYALTTIKKQLYLLSGFITYANLEGLIIKPLHKGVKMPSESVVRKHRQRIIAYDKEEQRALKRVLYAGDNPPYHAILLMLETGMRVGEVLALEWDDIDWKRRSIRISKTMIHNRSSGRSYIQNGAKSFTSNRTIPMSSEAYDVLNHMQETRTYGSEFIFHNTRGDMLTYESLRWWTRRACDEAGVLYHGQHVFRHTFATNCYDKGCDVKILSKFLGHADVSVTYNVYIHLFGDGLEEMRAIVG